MVGYYGRPCRLGFDMMKPKINKSLFFVHHEQITCMYHTTFLSPRMVQCLKILKMNRISLVLNFVWLKNYTSNETNLIDDRIVWLCHKIIFVNHIDPCIIKVKLKRGIISRKWWHPKSLLCSLFIVVKNIKSPNLQT